MKFLKFCFILLLFPLMLQAKATQPSPYFVHDMESYFWEIYSQTMQIDAPSKLAVQGIFTPYYYNADFFFEGTFGLKRRDAMMKLSELTRKKNLLTWMAGYAFFAIGDGNPENSFPAANQNIANTFLLGMSYYSKDFMIRAGYIYGAYALKDSVFYESTDSYVKDSDYFNYSSEKFQTGSGFDRLTDPDSTYSRLLLEFETEFDFLILKLLNVANIKDFKNPAFTYFSPGLKLFRGKYFFTPYVALTNDVEGKEDFGMQQYGIKQKIFIKKSWSMKSIYLNFNMNYTTADETSITKERSEFFAEADFVYELWGFSLSYNTETETVGAGVAFLYSSEYSGDIWIRLKYNPYSASPVYLRNISDKGWSVEMGYRVNFYRIFDSWLY